ncbi:MAG: nitroreductase family protein [Kiritimatiellae bacterium]|jgi:nitroreductase|nr:nitroreductase family protein [Kiritimatiellia bacterium]NLD90194.1 NAD(P)H nitroreductase [Lentisphaerota bacterium]HOU22085.1 nitroreductase family protein [Kiritimatiellia bacterium]HPC19901.1 nitroreductase family protein [Kiritimatiellia bacterium]HQN79488.1 nitroreductase family protein [Kiritimatiellia bacterium]
MTLLELIQRRQSTRSYEPGRRIDRTVLDRCLEAARLAPSACNSQPWSFVVVDEPDRVRALAEAACTRPPYGLNKFVRDSSALIAVVTEKMKLAARLGAQFRGVQYNLIDIGIATEHLVLQATEEGLASCWLGWFNERAVQQHLGLPRASKVDLLIALGYPQDAPIRTKIRRSLDDIRRYV